MIDHGAKIRVIDVDGWYDAGKIDTLLDTNRAMLAKGRARRPASVDAGQVVEPVYIEDGVTVTGSKVGPNVSIGAGSVIENAVIRDTIIGVKARIARSTLTNSVVGDEVVLVGVNGEVTIGDHSEVRAEQR
jgi:glucose-1-phosphate thymidylyltransferase